MVEDTDPWGFAREWMEYLQDKGHKVKYQARAPQVIHSRDNKGRSYAWLLLTAQGPSRRLSPIEQENIRRLLVPNRHKRQVYLVVHFPWPRARVVVLSADQAARRGRISSLRGGIDWD